MSSPPAQPPRSWYGLLSKARGDAKPWLIVPVEPQRSDRHISVSYHELSLRALRIAGALRACGADVGERVVVIADNTVESCLLLIATLASGLVAVPVAPRNLGQDRQRWHETLQRVCSHAKPLLIVGRAELLPTLSLAQARSVAFETLIESECAELADPVVAEDRLALIQYTSGTTALPRGVELTHGNILSNVAQIGRAIGTRESDVGVTWLPLFHDMGLIGCLLYSTYWHTSMVLLTPRAFLTRPEVWLWAMSRFNANSCAAPNSAYQICATKIPERKLHGLDLSSWRVAMNGSELVHPDTIEAFCSRFGPYGFPRHAMYPVYGLAENTLATTFPEYGAPPKVDWVDRQQLETAGVAAELTTPSSTRRAVVSVGRALDGQQVRIADPSSNLPRSERQLGCIQVQGPCVMRGYHADPERTAQALGSDGWLHTGDRGYLAGGELYIVGRDKQLIKRGGRSYDASDVQAALQSAVSVRNGAIAVFGIPDDATGTEALVVMAEAPLREPAERTALEAEISDAVLAGSGIRPDVIALVAPGSIPRTTSGKIQHSLARERYLATMRTPDASAAAVEALAGASSRSRTRDRGTRGSGACLVLSSGRCGSTLLSTALREHPEVLSLSEFFTVVGVARALARSTLSGIELAQLFDSVESDLAAVLERERVPEILLDIDFRSGGSSLAGVSPLSLVPLPHLTPDHAALLAELRAEVVSYPAAPIALQLTRLFDWLLARFGRRVWVERSGGSIEFAEQLTPLFPQARSVFLLRDGGDCALSMSRHPLFRLRLARLLSRDPALPVEEALRREIGVDRFGAYWSALMIKTERLIANADPARTLVLRYEDLTLSPAETLRRVARLLEVESGGEEWLERAVACVRPATSHLVELGLSERERLQRACRPGMRILARLAQTWSADRVRSDR